MTTPSIVLDGIVCMAGGRAVLEIPQLNLAQGERVAVVGHNGAGKSTLLRLLTGFMAPMHGQVQVLGRQLVHPVPAETLRAMRQKVGQVLQGLHLVGRLSVLENVLIGALGRVPGWRGWTRCFPAGEIVRAEAALQSVGLLALAGTRADRLSGGERQKAAIARLLVQAPSLILADEPTAALDPSAAAEVCRLLVEAAAGKTLITVVHNPSLLPLLAERVIGLKQGRIAFDLPVGEVDDTTLMRLYRPEDSPQKAFWEIPSASKVLAAIGSKP